MIKIAAIDLDDTLFDENKRITAYTEETLGQAAALGTEIVPCTGRPFGAIPANVKALGFVNYYITCNGAALYDKNGNCLVEHTMDSVLSAELAGRLSGGFDISVDAFIGGRSYRESSKMSMIDELDLSDLMKEYIRSTRVQVENLKEYILGNSLCVQKFTLNFKADGRGGYIDRENVRGMLSEYREIDVVSGGMANLEITRKGINKGTGLTDLAGIIGADISETMMIGDSENDLEAIKCAGIGVAMENSEKFVIEAADYVTLSNRNDGAAAAVRHFILK